MHNDKLVSRGRPTSSCEPTSVGTGKYHLCWEDVVRLNGIHQVTDHGMGIAAGHRKRTPMGVPETAILFNAARIPPQLGRGPRRASLRSTT